MVPPAVFALSASGSGGNGAALRPVTLDVGPGQGATDAEGDGAPGLAVLSYDQCKLKLSLIIARQGK